MLPIHPLKGECGAPTCATTARSWSSTDGSRFTGSQNLIEAGYDKPKNHELGREWVELMMRLEGPVVRQLNVVFATDWFSETGEDAQRHDGSPGARGPGPPGRGRGRRAARWCRADRGSRPRTTCGSSTA